MTHFLRHGFPAFLYRHAAALACILVATLALKPFESALGIQIIALIFLLPVIISTVLWGLTPGVLAAFAAFLSFNYNFLPPYHTFRVHKTQDLITLIIFLIVAVVMSQLLGQARAGVLLARSREWEATRMYELISALSGLQDASAVAEALARQTLETFHAAGVEVLVRAGTITAAGDPAAGDIRVAAGDAAAGATLRRTPMRTARGSEGEIVLRRAGDEFSAAEERLLEACASQGALALERIRLARGETKTRILEESDRLKSSLLNSVSHELRTPLAAIKASVSSLRSGAVEWNTAGRAELLATIEEETDHLNLLVGNLLDMSRIESGALSPQLGWNALSEIAAGVATKMRAQLQNHELVIDFPPGLPLVPTDYVMIGQVFTNLISNSVKYAPPETVIALKAACEADNIHIQVTNQGPPVPEEHLARIFDKFYRITAAERITGTGLGLSICKGIVEAHGGEIWAENQPDCFAFHFTLPLTMDGRRPDEAHEAAEGRLAGDGAQEAAGG